MWDHGCGCMGWTGMMDETRPRKVGRHCSTHHCPSVSTPSDRAHSTQQCPACTTRTSMHCIYPSIGTPNTCYYCPARRSKGKFNGFDEPKPTCASTFERPVLLRPLRGQRLMRLCNLDQPSSSAGDQPRLGLSGTRDAGGCRPCPGLAEDNRPTNQPTPKKGQKRPEACGEIQAHPPLSLPSPPPMAPERDAAWGNKTEPSCRGEPPQHNNAQAAAGHRSRQGGGWLAVGLAVGNPQRVRCKLPEQSFVGPQKGKSQAAGYRRQASQEPNRSQVFGPCLRASVN